jgi:hypothetical protein
MTQGSTTELKLILLLFAKTHLDYVWTSKKSLFFFGSKNKNLFIVEYDELGKYKK